MSTHTTCLLILSVVSAAYCCSYSSNPAGVLGSIQSLTQSDIQLILDLHNNEKANTPVPTYGAKLYSWNSDLQRNAELLASRCVFSHSKSACRQNIGGYASLGENIAAGGPASPNYAGQSGLTTLIQNWIAEKQYYSWSSLSCNNPGGTCGHYTQVVWGDSETLGCAVATCPSSTNILGGFEAKFLVCQYGPAGNYIGEAPQTKATAGTAAYNRPCGTHGVARAATGGCNCLNGYKEQSGTCVLGTSSSPPPPPNTSNPPPPPPNPCNSLNCGSFGNCVVQNNVATCQCSNGYSGTTCQTAPNPCSPNPCSGGATCTANGNSYTCASNNPPPPPPATIPAQAPIVAAVFNEIAARSNGMITQEDSELQAAAYSDSGNCGGDSYYGTSITLCNFQTMTDPQQLQMYAGMIVDMIAGYNEFWQVADKLGVAMDIQNECGACDLGTNHALVLRWGSSNGAIQSTMKSTTQPKLHLSYKPTSHKKQFLVAGVSLVCVAAVLAAVVVYRKRSHTYQRLDAGYPIDSYLVPAQI